jgi:hypothetical protein
MRKGDVILWVNGHGTCDERGAAHLCNLEKDDMNGEMEEEEEEWGGRNEAQFILRFASHPDHHQCFLTF